MGRPRSKDLGRLFCVFLMTPDARNGLCGRSNIRVPVLGSAEGAMGGRVKIAEGAYSAGRGSGGWDGVWVQKTKCSGIPDDL